VVVFAGILAAGSVRWGGGGAVRTVRVGIVQPNARVDVELHMPLAVHRIGQLRRATRALEDGGAEVVVWSETAFPLDLPRDLAADNPRNHPLSLRGSARGPLIIGAVTTDDHGRRWNSAIVVAPDGAFLGRQDKIHRMIGSEYNPLIETFPSLEKYMPQGAGSYAGGDRVALLTVPVRGGDLRVGIMICLEDVVPSHGRELAALDPDLLVNLTNDTWFDLDAEPHQHEALARFRAIEVGVPLVRAVNTGPSSVIDVDGAIVARTATRRDDPPTTLLVDVPIAPRLHSLYATTGGWITWGVALAAVGWWLGPWLLRWRQRRKRACCA
jgi:apolipoprotein N-acyltransferase